MEEYKRRIELFSLYDHTNIEKHLEKMASEGWMIDTIGSTFWRYKKIEPKKVKFSVVYYPKDVKEGTTISDDRQNFIDLCSSGGWNYVINSEKMHIFSTDDENAPPIDTDAPIQIECIHKFAKAEIVYGYLFLIFACIFFSGFVIYELWKEPVNTLKDATPIFWLTPVTLIFSVINIISYLNWYRKAKSAAENGEFTDTKMIIRFEVLFWFPLYFGFGLLGFFSFLRIRDILLTLGIILSGILLFVIYKAIKNKILKSERKEISKIRLKRFAAVMLAVLWLSSGIGTYIAIPKPYYKVKVKSEFGNMYSQNVYLDKNAPLDISDFKETGNKTVSREKIFRELLLIKETEWSFGTVEDDKDNDGLFLYYSVTDVRFTPLLYRCKNEIIFNHIVYDTKEIHLTDKFESYRYYIDDKTPMNSYAFCNGNRIISVDFSWEPSEEELIFAVEELLNSQNTYAF
ncbi:MAG: DUF2812 domain-containing protein [Clostridia bacterium]|nr:DUF2812 domain-containing protein [Clostridia bacterium]